MAWLKGLAGKAEDFLNQIDQNAAVAFQNEKEKHQSKREEPLTEVTWNTPYSLGESRSGEEPRIDMAAPGKGSPPKQPTIPSDEKLMQFLNSPDSPEEPPPSAGVTGMEEILGSSTIPPSLLAFYHTQSMPHASGSAGRDPYDTASRVASLGLCMELSKENTLLKNELRAAACEISNLRHRVRAAEKSNSKSDAEDYLLPDFQVPTSQATTDPRYKISEKTPPPTSAYAVSKEVHESVRNLEIGEELLKTEPKLIKDLKKKIEELMKEKDTFENKFQASQLQVKQLEEMCDKLKQDQKAVADELDQYRTRAQRVLQEKEKIISELRGETSGTSSLMPLTSSSLLEESSFAEIDKLQQEKELFREENAQISMQLKAAREEFFEMEKKLDSFREQASDCERKLQADLLEERRRRQAAEEDARNHGEELRSVQEEFTRQRNVLADRVRERELELTRLRGQLAQRPAGSEDELEHRLHTLTQTLVQKQTSLETVSTERNALRLQLEKLEDKYRHVMALLQQYQTNQTTVNDTDDVKAQVPALFIESPFDTGISLRVKRAYSSLDAVSIRTGVFLRRYPLARILVFWYIILLHLWVVFVLLSYSPSPQ